MTDADVLVALDVQAERNLTTWDALRETYWRPLRPERTRAFYCEACAARLFLGERKWCRDCHRQSNTRVLRERMLAADERYHSFLQSRDREVLPAEYAEHYLDALSRDADDASHAYHDAVAALWRRRDRNGWAQGGPHFEPDFSALDVQ